MNKMLYGWVFTYNPYEDEWKCCQRHDYFALFNGNPNALILRTKGVGNINTLLDIINRTNGDVEKIKELTKNESEVS